MRWIISLPASIATDSGLNGESPLAISSALTNSRHSNRLGNTAYEAVVFPAPLHPAIMYNIGSVISLTAKNPAGKFCLRDFFRRSDRDSNSGYAFGVYTLSRCPLHRAKALIFNYFNVLDCAEQFLEQFLFTAKIRKILDTTITFLIEYHLFSYRRCRFPIAALSAAKFLLAIRRCRCAVFSLPSPPRRSGRANTSHRARHLLAPFPS